MMKNFGGLLLLCLLIGCSAPKATEKLRLQVEVGQARQVVVTYHPVATQIGYEILNRGGNAFDAFVAATAAEYVLGESVTSLAGPLGALLYDARVGKAEYLDAGFNTPLDPKQKWDSKNPQPGAAALVPGAVAGLEAISKKYGRLSLMDELEPAIKLAESGFVLNSLYSAIIASPEYGGLLKQSAYGRKTFFRDAKPLVAGDLLTLPEVASFLRQVAKHGSRYVYQGGWTRKCIKAVRAQGGHLSSSDFSSYKIYWRAPWKISYRGYEIYSPQTYGGLNTLLSLKVLEHTDITKYGPHFSQSADAVEIMDRVQEWVGAEPWLKDRAKTDDATFVAAQFSQAHLDDLWAKVEKRVQLPTAPNTGTHSFHIVVVDQDGNAVTGTNTIESLPWGKGIFVEGIPLTAAGILPFASRPGERRRSSLTMQLGVKEGRLRFASGAYSASLLAAAFEFIVNIVDYKLSSSDVVSLPRFGNRAWDLTWAQNSRGGIWLDPRIEKSIVSSLEARGLKTVQSGHVDTGMGAVAVVHDDQTVEGSIATHKQ